jgi:hypothetical protein
LVLDKFNHWIELGKSNEYDEWILSIANRELDRVQWTAWEKLSQISNRVQNTDVDRVKNIEFWSRKVEELAARRESTEKSLLVAVEERVECVRMANEATNIWYQTVVTFLIKIETVDTSTKILERCLSVRERLLGVVYFKPETELSFRNRYFEKSKICYHYGGMIRSGVNVDQMRSYLQNAIQDFQEISKQLSTLAQEQSDTQTA